MNPYIALMLNGFSTGMGVVVAQHIYDLWLRKKVTNTRNKYIRIKRTIKKLTELKK